MTTTEELDMIARMRSEVTGRKDLTGENLFLAWGLSYGNRAVPGVSGHSVLS